MKFCNFFAIIVFYDLNINQIDMKIAFLYRAINQLYFIKMPKNYYNNCENMICKLNKVFYGLKQFSQLWYK